MKNSISPIADLICGYRKAKILFVAASLDLFSRTAGRGGGAGAVASALGGDLRAVTVLLDALVSMGFLKKKGGRYCNSPLAGKFLVPGKRGYVGNNLCYQDIIWDAWGALESVVKSGRTSFPLRKLLARRKGFLDGYIKGMANIAEKPAAEVAAKLGLAGAKTMLDVGGGPGTYTIAFLRARRALRGVILDLPGTLGVTRRVFAKHPYTGRVSFQAGDYHKAPFGENRYDVVLLSNVTHDEGPEENLNLLRKSFAALRPGGRVVVHDFMLDRGMSSPEFAALFSVHMLVYTNKGRVYSSGEYRAWLRQAGFTGIFERDIRRGADNPSRMIVGIKK